MLWYIYLEVSTTGDIQCCMHLFIDDVNCCVKHLHILMSFSFMYSKLVPEHLFFRCYMQHGLYVAVEIFHRLTVHTNVRIGHPGARSSEFFPQTVALNHRGEELRNFAEGTCVFCFAATGSGRADAAFFFPTRPLHACLGGAVAVHSGNFFNINLY